MILESKKHNFDSMYKIAIVTLIYTAFILVITGGHYSNDIIFGILWAYAAHLMAVNTKYIANLMFFKGFVRLFCCCPTRPKGKVITGTS